MIKVIRKYIQNFISVNIFLLFIAGITMVQAKETHFFYGVDIDLHNVGVDIRVNDVPVYYDYTKGQLTVELPAPDRIIDGENELSINAFLPYKTEKYEEGAYVKATFFKQQTGDKTAEKLKLVAITLTIKNDLAIELTENFTENLERTKEINLSAEKTILSKISTTIDSPFPRWAWQDGKTITNSPETFDSLLETYKAIHLSLKSKNLEQLRNFYNARAKETAIAYYLDDEEAGYQKLSVGSDLHNEELKLIDIVTKHMELKIMGNGKLAQISNPLNGQPILYFQTNPRLYHLYKFMFYLNDNNKWIMIR